MAAVASSSVCLAGSSFCKVPSSLTRRESRRHYTARKGAAVVKTNAVFNPWNAMKKKKATAPVAPPAGTEADATFFKAAGVALAVPTLPTFFNTRPVLDAFNMSNSDPTAFESIENVQHFSNLFGSDCFSLVALCSLYVLADAAENSRLVRKI